MTKDTPAGRVETAAKGGGIGFVAFLDDVCEAGAPTSQPGREREVKEIEGGGVRHCSRFEVIIVEPI